MYLQEEFLSFELYTKLDIAYRKYRCSIIQEERIGIKFVDSDHISITPCLYWNPRHQHLPQLNEDPNQRKRKQISDGLKCYSKVNDQNLSKENDGTWRKVGIFYIGSLKKLFFFIIGAHWRAAHIYPQLILLETITLNY